MAGLPQGKGSSHAGSSILPVVLAMVLGGVVTLLLIAVFGRGPFGFLFPTAPSLPSLPTLPPLVLPTPAPTPTPKIITGQDVVRQIQQLSRLESSAYSVQTVVTVERPGNIIGIGRQRLLMIVHGNVVAGIDLNRLRGQDVTVSPDGKKVRLRLPEAEILSAGLDESRTQIYDFQTGLFTQPDANLIVEAQKAGVAQILKTACQDGILQRATDNSQRSMRQLLAMVGFENVEIEEAVILNCPTSLTPLGTPAPAAPTAAATPAPTTAPTRAPTATAVVRR